MKNLSLIFTFALLFSGCATQTFYFNSNSTTTPAKLETQTFFISGLGQEQAMNAAEICGGAFNVAAVESKQNAIDIVLGVLTLGIYTPRSATVYCLAQ